MKISKIVLLPLVLGCFSVAHADDGLKSVIFTDHQTPVAESYIAAIESMNEQCKQDQDAAKHAVKKLGKAMNQDFSNSISISTFKDIVPQGQGMQNIVCKVSLSSEDPKITFSTESQEFAAKGGSTEECESQIESLQQQTGYLNSEIKGPYYRDFKRYCSVSAKFIKVAQ